MENMLRRKMRKSRSKIIFLNIILLAGFIFGLKIFFVVNAKEKDGFLNKPELVRIKTAEIGSIETTDKYSGFVKGDSQSKVAPKVNGRVASVLKNEGEKVKKGEIVVILSADEMMAQNNTAREVLNSLYLNLEKTEAYYKQKVDEAKDKDVSKEELKSAKRLRDLQVQAIEIEVSRAKGGINEIQSLTKELMVRAPFDGIISEISTEVGELAGSNIPVFEIAQENKPVLEVFVSREVLAQIKNNQSVTLFDSSTQRKLFGKIGSLGVISENYGQKALVKIYLEGEDVYLGQYLVVNFSGVRSENKIVIDEKSVVSRYDDNFVFLVEGNLVKQKKISLGKVGNGKVEILEGISVGDKVVVDGINKLRSGDEVEIYE